MVEQTADNAEPESNARGGGAAKNLLFGLLAALLLGGTGFWVVWSGTVDIAGLTGGKKSAGTASHTEEGAPEISFVPIDSITVSLPPGASARHLRFTGQLEVEPDQMHDVEVLMPRILDVLNTYLRAVDVKDLEQSSSAILLRAQMLRRVQVVTGHGRVRDLLITEFILN